ncbi:restriction endonuclease or methylase [Iodidimonas nitroreducens]|uniref:Restriction endonuclease or methylase n=1 Tax=Iodidimonas nitroreducens TaxID=1236968 RepID=A0A5A7N959_9PROT|nr:type I restriction endonuclease [Iodidimonas nitroreducens]GAK32272.1 hypothetical protein AQ1_00136 [alpha proteobacterium Q-1]GER04883.1 restriction endonuclease or methylase [Iodidimonas nitroreducens]
MDLYRDLQELQKKTIEQKQFLATEEAAKTSLVLPFIRALGYDVFNPSEVIPEFNADVGIKKGEKVDYAVCKDGKVNILIECKPSSMELNVSHAHQLFRYFSVTDARLAILTNGIKYQFYSDIENSNKMDDNPFYIFDLSFVRNSDIKILENFTKKHFSLENIIEKASDLRVQSLVIDYLKKEFLSPSDDLISFIAKNVHNGRITATIKDNYSKIVPNSISVIIRDLVNERLSTALKSSSSDQESLDEEKILSSQKNDDDGIVTTEEEISGYRIIQAIAAKYVSPKRIYMRDSKSYAAILFDDNNRKQIARLHFNGKAVKYIGTFNDREEIKHPIQDTTEIYELEDYIIKRIKELDTNN